MLEVTDKDFDEKVLQSSIPVVVDFSAAWCGPCQAMVPVLEGIEKDYSGHVSVFKMDVDSNPLMCAEYAVRSVPMLLFFVKGEVVECLVGAQNKSKVVSVLNKTLA
jgi:thioredoxin 1